EVAPDGLGRVRARRERPEEEAEQRPGPGARDQVVGVPEERRGEVGPDPGERDGRVRGRLGHGPSVVEIGRPRGAPDGRRAAPGAGVEARAGREYTGRAGFTWGGGR